MKLFEVETASAPTDAVKTVKKPGGSRLGRMAGALLIALAALGAPLALTGCGGGGGKQTSANAISRAEKGTITFNVIWPERNRLIPDATESIDVTITRAADADIPTAFTRNITLRRPAAGQPVQTPAVFNEIPTGSYTIVAVAYPGRDGAASTGANVPVARSATRTVTLAPNDNAAETLSLASTITTIRPLLPGGFVQTPVTTLPNPVSTVAVTRIRPGQSLQLSAAAADSAGNAVLLTPGKLRYSAEPAGIVTINNNTVTANPVAGDAVERAVTITVVDTESNVDAGAPTDNRLSVTVTPVGLSENSPWPKFHGDLQNTGIQAAKFTGKVNDAANVAEVKSGSTFQFSSPVVGADGTSYIGTFNTGELLAIGLSGEIKWRFQGQGNIDSAPVIAKDGTIFFATTAGRVYAVRDGDTKALVLWDVNLNTVTGRTAPVYVSPTLDQNGGLYIATAAPDNRVYVLDSLTGVRLLATDGAATRSLEYQTADSVTNTPTFSPNQQALYVADNSANVYRIETGIPTVPGPNYAANGFSSATLRRRTLDEGVAAGTQQGVATAPVYAANVAGTPALFVATTGSNQLYALNPTTLTTINKAGSTTPWIIDTNGAVYSTPALSPDGTLLYYATQDYSSGVFDHKVAAVQTDNGNLVWRTPELNSTNTAPYFTDGFNASPAVSSDGAYLYIAGYDGNIYQITATAAGGAVRAPKSYPAPNISGSLFLGSPALRQAPGEDTSAVVIGAENGSVYILE